MNNLILLAATATKTVETDMSMWGMIIKGGWLMIPIFLLSIIAIYIFFERYLLIQKYSTSNGSFMDRVKKCIDTGNKQTALDICANENTPMARITHKGISHDQLPPTELRAIIESSANLEVASMEKGLNTLATCAGMAPMIGFLGTVIGMVQAFYDMALAGNNINITLLSRGIYTAMITTVAGLVVGITAYFAYNVLVSRIDSVVTKMENTTAKFMEIIYELKNKKQNN